MKLQTYYHTLKYLKFSQIYHRIVKRITKPKPNNIACTVAARSGDWTCCELYNQKVFDNDAVRFLNRDAIIKGAASWNDESYEKLWLYNLHYFDDLNAIDVGKRAGLQVQLLTRWINENPAPKGNGWEPYPTSLRVVNWIKAFLGHVKPSPEMLNNLAKQADYLSQDLERHLLGNHLFVNAKALIFAGLYFEDQYSKKWLTTGLDIYAKELEEQVLADGGNFELTPMYHVIMLVDLLDLLNLFSAFPGRVEQSIIDKTHNYIVEMFKWLNAMKHCDNRISFFNDSAFGIAPEISVVHNYASQLGVNVKDTSTPSNNELIFNDLPETGYVSVRAKGFTLIADLCEVGPSYQPGHAHADSLSYEFTLHGNRVFVNSGISEYGVSKERLRQRQTAAHNTVVVDGLDSSQVWSGFRVAKRANIIDRKIEQLNDDAVLFSASHNGFKQQGVNCIHRRTWSVQPQRIAVVDNLIGGFKNAIGYLHLHPDVELVGYSSSDVKLSVEGRLVHLSVTDAIISVEDTSWQPEFGISLSNKKLCFEFNSNEMSVDISWRE